MMDVRDFIDGDDKQKDEFAKIVLNASIGLTSKMVVLAFRYAEEMPDEMRDELELILRSFHSFVSEFVDFEKLEAAIMEMGDENGTTA